MQSRYDHSEAPFLQHVPNNYMVSEVKFLNKEHQRMQECGMQGSGGVGCRWGQVGQRSGRLVQKHADDRRRQSHNSLISIMLVVCSSSYTLVRF